MNLTLAIDIHRKHLLRLVVALVALVTSGDGRLERRARLRVLAVLRPAEAAVRRLILVAAHVLKPEAGRVRVRRDGPPIGLIPRGEGPGAFALFDPRLRVDATGAGPEPRISWFDGNDTVRAGNMPPMEEELPYATGIVRRLASIQAALGDLPKQARRLARAQVRRRAAGSLILRPMRPGRPPGHRDRPRMAVERVLAECQTLAVQVPDTS